MIKNHPKQKSNPYVIETNAVLLFFLTETEYAIYSFMKNREECRKYGTIRISQERIASSMGISVSTVKRAYKTFRTVEMLLIDKDHRASKNNKLAQQYRMNDYPCANQIMIDYQSYCLKYGTKYKNYPNIELRSEFRTVYLDHLELMNKPKESVGITGEPEQVSPVNHILLSSNKNLY